MTIGFPRKLVKARFIGLIWVSIFVFLFSWFGYYCIFKAIYTLKPYQELVFYFDTYKVIEKKPDQLKKILDSEELKEQGLIEVSYYSYDIYGEETPYLKDVAPYIDFAVVPEFILDNYTGMADDFLNVESLVDLPSQYEIGFNGYAVKIYSSKDENYNQNFVYSDWLTFQGSTSTSSFYLLVTSYSKNFDKEKEHILGYTSLSLFLNDNLK